MKEALKKRKATRKTIKEELTKAIKRDRYFDQLIAKEKKRIVKRVTKSLIEPKVSKVIEREELALLEEEFSTSLFKFTGNSADYDPATGTYRLDSKIETITDNIKATIHLLRD